MRLITNRSTLVVPALLALLGALRAQEPAAAAPLAGPAATTVEQQSDVVTYRFSPEGISLEQAVNFATDASGMPINYKDTDFKGKPRIFMTGVIRVPRARLYEFWQAVFVTHGFAMIPMGPGRGDFTLLESIPNSQNLRQRASYVTPDELVKYQSKPGEVIMTTIPLKHIKVDQVRGTVTAFLTQRQAEFNGEVAQANAIVVMGFGPTIYALYQALQAMDQPAVAAAADAEVPRSNIRMAEEVQTAIKGMAKSKDSIQRRGAAYTLGALDDAAAMPTLIALLRDEDAGVREAAAQSLQRLATPRK